MPLVNEKFGVLAVNPQSDFARDGGYTFIKYEQILTGLYDLYFYDKDFTCIVPPTTMAITSLNDLIERGKFLQLPTNEQAQVLLANKFVDLYHIEAPEINEEEL